MDAVFELNGLASREWFDQLSQNLRESGGVALDDLLKIQPAGVFGAALPARFKAHLDTAAQLATVLTAVVTLYPAVLGGSPGQCRFTIADSSTRAEVVVPCDKASSPEFAAAIEAAVAKLREAPSSITVDPVRGPLEKSARGVGQS